MLTPNQQQIIQQITKEFQSINTPELSNNNWIALIESKVDENKKLRDELNALSKANMQSVENIAKEIFFEMEAICDHFGLNITTSIVGNCFDVRIIGNNEKKYLICHTRMKAECRLNDGIEFVSSPSPRFYTYYDHPYMVANKQDFIEYMAKQITDYLKK